MYIGQAQRLGGLAQRHGGTQRVLIFNIVERVTRAQPQAHAPGADGRRHRRQHLCRETHAVLDAATVLVIAQVAA